MQTYKRNHYVPQWYQHLFIPKEIKEKKFYYLDLRPEIVISDDKIHKRNALLRWGPKKCFFEEDLYTIRFGDWQSSELEEKFFDRVDSLGNKAIEYFSNFKYSTVNPEDLKTLLLFMSIQKLRTPKGLAILSKAVNLNDKNCVLLAMQKLHRISCALWAECVWSIADASESETKFIISDNPVTVYNKNCFPLSKWCQGFNDPDIYFSGTHTLFPLCLDKILILTNLSWLRNPYGNPLRPRPNFNPFRDTIFDFTKIQTGRMLSDLEVNEINFIIRNRAHKYIAAINKEWLYPEKKMTTKYWNKLGNGYLLMPDPRQVDFYTDIVIGYDDNKAEAFDEYGRRPWDLSYKEKNSQEIEWNTFHAFYG